CRNQKADTERQGDRPDDRQDLKVVADRGIAGGEVPPQRKKSKTQRDKDNADLAGAQDPILGPGGLSLDRQVVHEVCAAFRLQKLIQVLDRSDAVEELGVEGVCQLQTVVPLPAGYKGPYDKADQGESRRRDDELRMHLCLLLRLRVATSAAL